jgi:hypothetical protein
VLLEETETGYGYDSETIFGTYTLNYPDIVLIYDNSSGDYGGTEVVRGVFSGNILYFPDWGETYVKQ